MTDVDTSAPADVLMTIVAATRKSVESRRVRVPWGELEGRAIVQDPRGTAFEHALTRAGRFNVIAECKRRSPSKGVLRVAYDPVRIAQAYADAGAAAISVLTEPSFFDGALAHLTAVREAVTVPVLRKDFIVDEYQVLEARAAGADAILLIVAALESVRLRRLLRDAESLGLAALVEVHTMDELTIAVDAGARIVGVNSRSLRTLAVSLDTAFAMAQALPKTVIGVAESGIRTREDLERLRAAGYSAFLVGERLMTQDDPGVALRQLTDLVPEDGARA